MSEEEEYTDEETTGPIVVDVNPARRPVPSPKSARSVRSNRGRRSTRQRRHHVDDDNEIDDEDEYEEELSGDDEDYDEEVGTHRSHGHSRSSSRMKSRNGKRAVNMTPPDRLLKSATRKAERYADTNKVDKAIQERVRCLALTTIVYGSQHWRLAEAHVNLAEAYLDLKGYTAQAEYHTENAMAIMLNSVHTTNTENEKADVFSVLFNLNYVQGRALTQMKKYPEADTALAKADRAFQACSKLSCVTDDECDDMEIRLTHATARLSWRQKKYAVAGSQFDKVIDLTKRRFGDDAIELISVYQECGRLEQSKGRHANHDRAIDMFLQAHSIAGANYKGDSIELIDTALALAQAYSNTGKEEAEGSAESYLNECLASCTAVYGPHHKKTLEVEDELARLMIRTFREDDALEILRSSISPKGEVYGDYSEPVSDTYKLIASVHLAQGNIEKALRAYKKCLNIEGLVLGKNHKKYKDTERTIDILMASPGISNKFVLDKQDQLKKRPRFNAVVKRNQPPGAQNT